MANKYLSGALALLLGATSASLFFQRIENKSLETRLNDQTAAVRQNIQAPNYLESNDATPETFYRTLEQTRSYSTDKSKTKDFEEFYRSLAPEERKELVNYQRDTKLLESTLTDEQKKLLDQADKKATTEDYKIFFWMQQGKLTYADKATIALRHLNEEIKNATFKDFNPFSL